MAQFEIPNKLRMIETISNSKVCPRCMIFCMERKPWFKHGQSAVFFVNKGRLPETKVFCKNGCHEMADWGWRDITETMFDRKHIPRR